MAAKYPRHFIVIAGNQLDIGNDINIEEDLKRTYQTASFTLPYFDGGSFKLTDVKKYDAVQIYFRWFETSTQRYNATIDDCYLIFDGYVDEFSSSENKDDGLVYNLTCKTTMGLTYERSTNTKSFNARPSTIINKGLSETALTNSIPYYRISFDIDEIPLNIDASFYLGETLDSIREKYAIQVYQLSYGALMLRSPIYFNQQTERSDNVIQLGGGLSTRLVKAWEYDLALNVFDIDYGTPTNNVNCVIVYGNNGIGIAFDPVAYQLMIGEGDELDPANVIPNADLLNPLRIYRRDLEGDEACQKVAQQKLVDLAKNYTITFSSEYLPLQNVGDLFIIRNSKMIRSQQKWIIQRRTINISKEDINVSIVGYSNSVSDFPEDTLIGSTGVLDTDILEITDKVVSEID